MVLDSKFNQRPMLLETDSYISSMDSPNNGDGDDDDDDNGSDGDNKNTPEDFTLDGVPLFMTVPLLILLTGTIAIIGLMVFQKRKH